jgi:acyl-CoA synthetase (AMP-forming)/AMP-acid ligase II
VTTKPSFTSILRFWKRRFSECLTRNGANSWRHVVRKLGTDLSADNLIAHCRRFLANYKIPRHIEFSETELPKSGSGKILKRLLRERFWVGQKRAVA